MAKKYMAILNTVLKPIKPLCYMLNAPANRTDIVQLFTKREKEIIEHLMKGKLNKEIADELNISISMVKKHTKNIYKKAGVTRRIEVVMYLTNTLSA